MRVQASSKDWAGLTGLYRRLASYGQTNWKVWQGRWVPFWGCPGPVYVN